MKRFYSLFVLFALLLANNTFALSILLVNDNGYTPDRVEVIKQAITDAGYDYTFYDAAQEGSSPSYSLMKGFDLVIWYTGNDGAALFFWNASDEDNEAIKQYIDDGGMFWLQGLDFLYDRYKEVPWDFGPGDMMYDYFGISQYFAQSHVDDGLYSDGVPELDVMPGNGIFTMSPVKWVYDAMWYVDALLPVSNATALYRLGPEGYDFYDYYAAIYHEKGDGKVMTFTFETARIDTPENTKELFKEGLDYFDQFGTGEIIYVTDIDVHGEGGVNTITENEGTLQMVADVYPDSATNKAVLWSVTPGTAYATIDGDGVLHAAGSSIGNGTVWVKATAADGSGVCDSTEITITNQASSPGVYNILLVNDNSYGIDRYLVLDTTLMDLNKPYDVYNIVEMGKAPDLITMAKYQLVIWYTGNDGSGLKLWDVSDTLNYKFNKDLIDYINLGGDVWLQGLDFIYDVVGVAPDDFAPGQFIYDYMGIKSYVGQSHVDDEEINLLQLDVVPDNGICTFTPIKWVYDEGLWYADAFDITPEATSLYTMGPAGYPLYGKTTCLMTHPSEGYLMTWAIETARIDTRQHTEEIFNEVLTWFENHTAIEEREAVDGSVVSVFPNPAQNFVTVKYILDKNADVSLKMYDVTGKLVAERNSGRQTKGEHQITISKEELNATGGLYFYSLSLNNKSISGKVIFK